MMADAVRSSGRPLPLLLSHTSTVYGGMEIHVEMIARHIDRARYTPSLYVPSDPLAPVPRQLVERLRDLDVEIISDDPGKLAHRSPQIHHIVAFTRVLRRQRVAVLHVHTAQVDRPRVPFVAAAIARTPAVVRTEHLPPIEELVDPSVRRTARFVDRLTDRMICVSEQNRQEQIRVVGRSPNKMDVLRNGVPIPPLATEAERRCAKQQLGLPPEDVVVGSIGRLDEQKGFSVLLDAVAALPPAMPRTRVLIAGDGPLRSRLEDQARSLGLEDTVHLIGHTDRPAEVISAIDIAVMPSLYEGFSLSMLELMAAGKPCIFSDHASFQEATDSGRVAVLTPRGDVSALASSLADLISDQTRAARLGSAARDHASRNFSIEHYVSTLMELYDEIVDRRNAPVARARIPSGLRVLGGRR